MEKAKREVKRSKQSTIKYKRIVLDKETMLCLNVIYDNEDKQKFKIYLDDGYELRK